MGVSDEEYDADAGVPTTSPRQRRLAQLALVLQPVWSALQQCSRRQLWLLLATVVLTIDLFVRPPYGLLSPHMVWVRNV